jgi:hypothetical protein
MMEARSKEECIVRLDATDKMIAAAVLFIQDQCGIQSESAAANIARGVWDRMIESAPLERPAARQCRI